MARRRGARRTSRRTTRRVVHRTRRRMRRRMVLVGGFVVLAASGTYAAVKLSQQDAQRIEEHTGQPPDQLEDQDLQDAMQELSIQSEPLTDEDQAELGASATEAAPEPATAPAPAAAPAPVAAPAPAGDASYLAELEKLGELRDKGIITDAEFEAKKKELLGL
jgi:hypothetical protein